MVARFTERLHPATEEECAIAGRHRLAHEVPLHQWSTARFQYTVTVSAPLVPSPLDYVGPRRFAFYPPIRHSGPNEWFLRGGTWAEVHVVNAHTGAQFWVPRQYVGGVSDAADLILVVELVKELSLGEEGLGPVVKRVIEMPPSGTARDKPLVKRKRRRGPAPVIGIRPEKTANARAQILARVGLGAIIICVMSAILAFLARL